jgi:hypothetical protein
MFGQFVELTDRTQEDDLVASIASMRVASAAFRQTTRFSSRIKLTIFVAENGATKGQIRSQCEDISETGMGLILTESLNVGGDYWVAFDKGEVEITGLVHVRCVRCRMIEQGRFETGFRFYNSLTLPSTIVRQHDDELY